jgi:hypothetical protein
MSRALPILTRSLVILTGLAAMALAYKLVFLSHPDSFAPPSVWEELVIPLVLAIAGVFTIAFGCAYPRPDWPTRGVVKSLPHRMEGDKIWWGVKFRATGSWWRLALLWANNRLTVVDEFDDPDVQGQLTIGGTYDYGLVPQE